MSVVAAVAFERLPVPGLLLELDGIVIAANAAACAVVGLPASELVGRPISELIDGGERLTRAPGEVHDLHVASSGGRRTLQCVVTRLEAEGRTVLQVFGLDISSRTEAEAAARARADLEETSAASQRLESLGIVAGGIAHEFNNLLVGVLAESSAAREDEALPDETREALARIEVAAQRMAHLTRLMLAYAGRGRYLAVQVDPDELIAELRDQLVRLVGGGARLEIHGGGGGVVVEADVQMLRQVVLDLVANAAEAGGTQVTITTRIVVRQHAPWLQLEVSDDGVGIDARTISRIFEPFFTTKPDHHGLGLSAVHGIVRRLGGDIEVDSTPGRGARLRVRVPVVASTEVPRRASTDGLVPIAKLTGLKVLVADDEPSVLATVRRLLQRRGAIVVPAIDGAEAEARLAEEPFGLVILDVSMPGQSGYDVLASARALQPGVPVVLMSGYTNRAHGEGVDAEPDAFLEKPFTARQVDDTIDGVMKRGR